MTKNLGLKQPQIFFQKLKNSIFGHFAFEKAEGSDTHCAQILEAVWKVQLLVPMPLGMISAYAGIGNQPKTYNHKCRRLGT